ncbi:MAG TPA: hypothetical protein VMF87_15750, partial [Streptosporangiaceae bacterium]|nr:hypothetical protein [Streptosporangiaceae bacterium]
LVKWCVFAVATGRRPRLDVAADQYFEIADDPDASYDDKLAAYGELADGYFESERYQDFCATRLAHMDELVLDWVSGPGFDELLIQTVRSVYPPHEHDQFIAHLRGLTGLWARDESARLLAAG